MIAALFIANFGVARNFGDPKASSLQIAIGLFLSLLFFFHLRLFDEIKDFQTDREINRDRPLPRGLMKMAEFKRVLWSVLILELLLSLTSGPASFPLLIAIGYSILMYREFFIGNWLRPKMEAYAISHTFVSSLHSLFLVSLSLQISIQYLSTQVIWLMLINWMLFNTFEFARKTFSREEERAHVESYSKRWGLTGGMLWSAFFILLALLLVIKLDQFVGWHSSKIWILSGISALPLLSGCWMCISESTKSTKIFRAFAGLYLVLFSLALGVL